MNGDSKPELPRPEARQDRDVVGDQAVLARSEGVAELAEIDELCGLRLADDELGAALDRLVIVRVAIGQDVA